MKLLVADKLETEAITALRAISGLEVEYNPTVSKDALSEVLSGVHVLVVRSKEVRRAAIESAKALALIVRAGAGTNTIDVECASERGVYVANCPGKNAIAVAELAMALITSIDRRIGDATTSLRGGRWEKGEFGKADGLYGKRLGLAGLGAIGREVLARARAFGMDCRAFDPALTVEQAKSLGVIRAASLEALAAESDVFSIHLPLNKATRGIINGAVLSALPKRATVINTARAEVLDYDALAAAVASLDLRVGLDVFPSEPEGASATFTHPILSDPRVIATPHIGASTTQAQLAIAAETVRIVKMFIESGEAPNCVNVAARSPARCQLVVRHYDRVGVLAAVLGVLKKHALNVEEMANAPFEGHKASIARLRVSELVTADVLRELESSSADILHVESIAL
jgi:D-3-phosphoglycerate dehydrogenase